MKIKFFKFFIVLSNILFLLIIVCNPVWAQKMSKDGYMTFAKSYCDNKDYARSIATYNQALNLYGNNGNIDIVRELILAYYKYARANFLDKEYAKAMNNYRSVIFLINSFSLNEDPTYAKLLKISNTNLNICIEKTKLSLSIPERYEIANQLMKEKYYAAAGYEYSIVSSYVKYREACLKQLLLINQKYKNDMEIYRIQCDMDREHLSSLPEPDVKSDKQNEPDMAYTNKSDLLSEENKTNFNTNPITNRKVQADINMTPQPIIIQNNTNINGIEEVSSWEIYKNKLLPIIKDNWDNKFQGQNYVVEIEVKVSNLGDLLSCKFIKSSDIMNVDKTAMKAILKTYPFFSTDIQYAVKYSIKFDIKSGQIFISDPIDE